MVRVEIPGHSVGHRAGTVPAFGHQGIRALGERHVRELARPRSALGRGHRTHWSSIDFQDHGVGVGVHRDVGHRVGALGVAAAGDVGDRLLAPIGFVEEEVVLLYLPVEGHQTLRVGAADIAFVANRGTEVEHVPDEGTEKVRLGSDRGVIDLMNVARVFLRLITDAPRTGRVAGADVAALWVVRVVGQGRPSSVLADAQRLGRVQCMKSVKVLPELTFVGTVVPEEVTVYGVRVCNRPGLDRRRLDHHVVDDVALLRKRCRAARVFRLGERLKAVQQRLDIVVGIRLAGDDRDDGHLIADRPQADGGVVVLLADQFLQLLARVSAEAGRLGITRTCEPSGADRTNGAAVDERHLGPDHDAQRIGVIIGVLRVRVVGQTQGVRADLVDES